MPRGGGGFHGTPRAGRGFPRCRDSVAAMSLVMWCSAAVMLCLVGGCYLALVLEAE